MDVFDGDDFLCKNRPAETEMATAAVATYGNGASDKDCDGTSMGCDATFTGVSWP